MASLTRARLTIPRNSSTGNVNHKQAQETDNLQASKFGHARHSTESCVALTKMTGALIELHPTTCSQSRSFFTLLRIANEILFLGQ